MKIVQFQLKPFDKEVLAPAHQTYGDLVPSVTFFGGFSLPVYVSPVIPGQIHIFQNSPQLHSPWRGSLQPLWNSHILWPSQPFGRDQDHHIPRHLGQELHGVLLRN